MGLKKEIPIRELTGISLTKPKPMNMEYPYTTKAASTLRVRTITSTFLKFGRKMGRKKKSRPVKPIGTLTKTYEKLLPSL